MYYILYVYEVPQAPNLKEKIVKECHKLYITIFVHKLYVSIRCVFLKCIIILQQPYLAWQKTQVKAWSEILTMAAKNLSALL